VFAGLECNRRLGDDDDDPTFWQRPAREPREQTGEVLGKIDGLLKQGGTDKSKLAQATIRLQDIRTRQPATRLRHQPGKGPQAR
jgi:hypothetical protein